MSKKASKRARRRRQAERLPDARKAHLAHLERRGRLLTTPEDFRRRAVSEPFYLADLGLTRECWTAEPPYQPPPVIHRAP